MFINRRSNQRAYTIRCVKIMSCRYWISERRFIGSARLNVARFFPPKIMPIWYCAIGKLRMCCTPVMQVITYRLLPVAPAVKCCSRIVDHIYIKFTCCSCRWNRIPNCVLRTYQLCLYEDRGEYHVRPKCLIIVVAVITFPSEIFYSLGSKTTKVWLHWKCFAEW